MRASALKYAILSIATSLAMVILLLVPFHAFLTIWVSSLTGHYTVLRLWKEALLIICMIGAAYLLIADSKIRSHTLTRRLVWLIFAYGVINVIWAIIAHHQHSVGAKAAGYALIINLRFLAFFLVIWALALRTSRFQKQWQRLLLGPALIVVIVGLLQFFVLPNDFLRHFGYGPQTIEPFETINHNQQYIRIMSTLRGANPLGAYLLMPITLLSVLLLRGRRSWQNIAFLVAAILTLYFSFSRSAWIGAVLSVGVVAFISLRSTISKRWAVAAVLIGIIFLSGLALGLRHNTSVQNVVLHTQTHSAVKTTSNEGHVAALKIGMSELVHEPLGRGPGTAGPASVYNTNHEVRIAENYYIQLGQELGWIGLIFFVLINVGVGYVLWLRRSDPLALTLFACLIGLSFINLLSHAWTDDTIAYIWWGFAGIAIAMPAKKVKRGR